jgi:hypothetical protein
MWIRETKEKANVPLSISPQQSSAHSRQTTDQSGLQKERKQRKRGGAKSRGTKLKGGGSYPAAGELAGNQQSSSSSRQPPLVQKLPAQPQQHMAGKADQKAASQQLSQHLGRENRDQEEPAHKKSTTYSDMVSKGQSSRRMEVQAAWDFQGEDEEDTWFRNVAFHGFL